MLISHELILLTNSMGHNGLVGNPEGKRPLWRPTHKWPQETMKTLVLLHAMLFYIHPIFSFKLLLSSFALLILPPQIRHIIKAYCRSTVPTYIIFAPYPYISHFYCHSSLYFIYLFICLFIYFSFLLYSHPFPCNSRFSLASALPKWCQFLLIGLESQSFFSISALFRLLMVYSSKLKTEAECPPKRWYPYIKLCTVTSQKSTISVF
jgi:hypothetical protein